MDVNYEREKRNKMMMCPECLNAECHMNKDGRQYRLCIYCLYAKALEMIDFYKKHMEECPNRIPHNSSCYKR